MTDEDRWRRINDFLNAFRAQATGGSQYRTPSSSFATPGEEPMTILGISSPSEAPAAFKRLALQHHPDRFNDPDEKKKSARSKDRELHCRTLALAF